MTSIKPESHSHKGRSRSQKAECYLKPRILAAWRRLTSWGHLTSSVNPESVQVQGKREVADPTASTGIALKDQRPRVERANNQALFMPGPLRQIF